MADELEDDFNASASGVVSPDVADYLSRKKQGDGDIDDSIKSYLDSKFNAYIANFIPGHHDTD